ncbi:MAG: BatA domain-containing protein, partial [Candidatus Latescibacterota bacterium]
MQFLNSILLFGLGAAALPVIIHLLSRRKVKEVSFPSIEFLERMRTDRMRRLRFKQLLALLLRTLIVAMIILAFARPAIRSIFQRNARTAAVVLIDGSASMLYVDNGETLFNSAKRKAQEMLGALGPEDRAAIVLAGKEPVLSGGGPTVDRNELTRRLRSLECTGGTADLTAAFAKALEILSEVPVPNRELYFLTDGASGALPDSLRGDDRVRLYTILLGPAERGGAVVSDLDPEERLLAPGKKITFRASGYAGVEDDRIGVELFVNGERKGRTAAENRGGKFEARFEYTPENAGWLSVSAVARDGRFEPGETRRLALFVPEAQKVLVCGETGRDAFFIEKALNPDPETSAAAVRSVTARELNTDDLAADVIILSGVRALPSGIYRKLLSAVVDRGAGLVVFPPVDGDPALYADGIFRDIYPASIEKKVAFDPKQGASYIVWFNLGHPIFRDISERGGFREPTVSSYLRLAPRGNITVLARFADGAPALGTTVSGKGRAVVFAFDTSPAMSDLPLTGLFLPLLLRSV